MKLCNSNINISFQIGFIVFINCGGLGVAPHEQSDFVGAFSKHFLLQILEMTGISLHYPIA